MARPLGRPMHSSIASESLRLKAVNFLERLPKNVSAEKARQLMTADIPESAFSKKTLRKLKDLIKKNPREAASIVSKEIPDEYHRKIWERKAGFWNEIERKNAFLAAIDSIVRNVPLLPNDHILSLGSGTGVIECFLGKELVPQGRITMVDYAHGMNLQAQKLAREHNVQNLRFVTAAIDKIPLASGSVELVMSINSLQWVKNWQKTLSEVKRVLKKSEDSRFVVSVNYLKGTHQRADWGQEELLAELKRQGFESLHGTASLYEGQTGAPIVRGLIVARLNLNAPK